MDNRGKRQAGSIFGGMGFYIALLVCVIAAGVVGYYALLNDNEPTSTEDPLPVSDQADTGIPTDNTDLESTTPVLSDEPLEIPQSVKPEIPEDDKVTETGSNETPEDLPVSGDVEEENIPDPEPEVKEDTRIVSPLEGATVSVFSADRLMYDATLDDWRTHDGIDIRAEAGTQVVAAASGTVIAVGEDDRLGVNIVIEHSGGYVTTYASLHPETLVSVGDQVSAGQVIGVVGNTSLSEAGLGAHLHFSVKRNGELIDPAAYLPKEE